MKVDVVGRVGEHLLAEAWKLYRTAFEELNKLTVQRHLMYPAEFFDVMTDARVDKYVAWDDDGRIAGLSTFTNQLDAEPPVMPLISSAYFEHRWPDLYWRRRIWYCGFVAVAPHAQGTDAFRLLVEAMFRRAEADKAIIGLDVCRYNDEVRGMSRAIWLMLDRLSDGAMLAESGDQQTFWLYDTTGDTFPPVTHP